MNSVKINLNSVFFKIYLNSKDPIFGLFTQVLEQKKGLYHHAKIQGNLMIQFQENTQTDGRMEGRTDPISQDLSGYHRGSNKYNCSRLAFKSQRYRVP